MAHLVDLPPPLVGKVARRTRRTARDPLYLDGASLVA